MRETQQDFGLTDQAALAANAERALESGLETSEAEARPLYRPCRDLEAVDCGGCAPPGYIVRSGPVQFDYADRAAESRRFAVRGEAWACDVMPGLPQIVQRGPEVVAKGSMVGLPTDPKARKEVPVYTGFIKFFPRAILAQARLSYVATAQHHPDKGVHWDHSKSTDHLDCLMRHMIDDTLGVAVDTDKIAHKTKVAWRANADLETELRRAAGIK